MSRRAGALPQGQRAALKPVANAKSLNGDAQANGNLEATYHFSFDAPPRRWLALVRARPGTGGKGCRAPVAKFYETLRAGRRLGMISRLRRSMPGLLCRLSAAPKPPAAW